jgi:Lipid II flippase MurJ
MKSTAPTPAKKKTRISIGNVAALLVATSLVGQLLGFLRTKLVNANFPTSGPHGTDAYFAAFNVPDFFFFTLAAGALGVAFMPVLSDRLFKGDRKGVWELSASLMNFLAILMAVVGVIMFVFAEPLIKHIVAPGLPPEQLKTAATIMRFLAFNPLLFTLSIFLLCYCAVILQLNDYSQHLPFQGQYRYCRSRARCSDRRRDTTAGSHAWSVEAWFSLRATYYMEKPRLSHNSTQPTTSLARPRHGSARQHYRNQDS